MKDCSLMGTAKNLTKYFNEKTSINLGSGL